MKKRHMKNIVTYHHDSLPQDEKTDWKRVNAMSDQELEHNARLDKDSFLADEKFWQAANLVMPATVNKERITIRIDMDILDWLKGQGRGYQSRINTILRTCMYAMKPTHRHHKHR